MMRRSKRTQKVLGLPTNNEGPLKRPRGAGDCSDGSCMNSKFDKVRFIIRHLIVENHFFPFPTCTIYHNIIIKGTTVSLRRCAGVTRASVGIRVKGSAEELSGRLSGSAERLLCGWEERGHGSLMGT
jgi:hypothetical protein